MLVDLLNGQMAVCRNGIIYVSDCLDRIKIGPKSSFQCEYKHLHILNFSEFGAEILVGHGLWEHRSPSELQNANFSPLGHNSKSPSPRRRRRVILS